MVSGGSHMTERIAQHCDNRHFSHAVGGRNDVGGNLVLEPFERASLGTRLGGRGEGLLVHKIRMNGGSIAQLEED